MYSKLIANLPKTEDPGHWTLRQKVSVDNLEELISEYSYGDRGVDSDFFYLSMFTNRSGEFSLTSTEYTVYPGDC